MSDDDARIARAQADQPARLCGDFRDYPSVTERSLG